MIMIIDMKNIIMVSLFIIIMTVILLDNKKKSEHFADDFADDLAQIVDQDKKHIVDIYNFIDKQIVHTEDTFTIPNFKVNNLIINKNIVLAGSSTVNNTLNLLVPSQNVILNIFPRYTIVIYHNQNIPNRWALCDGETWWVHNTDVTIQPSKVRPSNDNIFDYINIQTPDLRGRFIYGSDQDTFAQTGGMEMVTLTEEQIPPHAHPSYVVFNGVGIRPVKTVADKIDNSTYAPFSEIYLKKYKGDQLYALDTSEYGTFAYKDPNSNYIGAKPHNNMPPYITSYYIMKL